MLVGKRVRLRPLVKKDLQKLNEWRNDYEVFKYLGGGFKPVSVDQQEKWMDDMIDTTGPNRRYAILDENDRHIGLVGLYKINFVNRSCEFGIYIGERSAQGKSYGTDALELMIDMAFRILNLRKMKLEVVAENTGAVKMYEKAGFKKVGTWTAERYIDGEYKDVLMMELLNF